MSSRRVHPVRLSADQARGGEIALRMRGQRLIFLTGLIGALILGFVLTFAGAR